MVGLACTRTRYECPDHPAINKCSGSRNDASTAQGLSYERKVPAYLLTIAFFFLVGESRVRCRDLPLPPRDEVSGYEQRAVGLSLASLVHVALPMGPTLMLDGR